MKKISCFLSAFIAVCSLNAQTNVFPSTGNVGIGTSTPQAKLHVAGEMIVQTDWDAPLTFNNSDNSWQYMQFLGNSIRKAWMGIDVNNNFNIYKESGGNILLMGTNVGLGNSTPSERLSVDGNVQLNGKIYWDWGSRAIEQFTETDGISQLIRFRNSMTAANANPKGGFDFAHYDGTSVMRITNGNVGIGTTVPQGKLAVNGTIFARKVTVTQTGWADYVFHPSYLLRSLAEVERFIELNKHLPDVPSTAEVEKNGLDLGDNQVILLKKIEELTLYAIQQNKRIEKLETLVKTLVKNKQ